MPTITLDTKYLLRCIGYRIGYNQLENQLSKLGLEVNYINDKETGLELTANRPDLLGSVGLARAVRNFMHRNKNFSYQIANEQPMLEIDVGSGLNGTQPFISGLVVTGIKLGEDALTDIINFTEKFCDTFGRNRAKIAIGLHNLDAIKPPLYYGGKSDKSFIPLNGTTEVKFSEIVRKHKKGIEYGYTIKQVRGARYPSLEDSSGVIALIPILNSERTKVTTKTTNLFVDITGTSEYFVDNTADMLACMFMDLECKVSKVAVKYKSKRIVYPEMKKRYIALNAEGVEEEIGVKIGPRNVVSLANKMGYEAAILKNSVRFSVPNYRLDIINEQDIVEDIAIAYGYDYIQPLAILSAQQGGIEQRQLFYNRLSETMVGMGFSEMMNSYLTNEETNFDKVLLQRKNTYIKLKNPKAKSITMMRTWVLPSVLKNLGMSVHEKMPQKVFELDMAFYLSGADVYEVYHIAGAAVDPKTNFNYMKSVIEAIFYDAGLDCKIAEFQHGSFIEGRCASIKTQGKDAGFFGELHPKVLNNFGIEEPAVAFEIDLSQVS